MAQSFNQVTLIGRVGKAPEIRSFQNGDRVANLSLATSESWKSKDTGEKKERTTWHNIVITNQGLVKVVENHVGKGSLLLIVGQLESRQYEKDGQTRSVTEITLRPYRGELTMLDSRSSTDEHSNSNGGVAGSSPAANAIDELENEIPF